MSCPPGCICRRVRFEVETTALKPQPKLCTAKPGECDCFAEEPAMVMISIPLEEAENIAAAAGDFAYIPTRLGPIINQQLEARK